MLRLRNLAPKILPFPIYTVLHNLKINGKKKTRGGSRGDRRRREGNVKAIPVKLWPVGYTTVLPAFSNSTSQMSRRSIDQHATKSVARATKSVARATKLVARATKISGTCNEISSTCHKISGTSHNVPLILWQFSNWNYPWFRKFSATLVLPNWK